MKRYIIIALLFIGCSSDPAVYQKANKIPVGSKLVFEEINNRFSSKDGPYWIRIKYYDKERKAIASIDFTFNESWILKESENEKHRKIGEMVQDRIMRATKK